MALNDATFHQAKASDQWSYYQAKSIKQNLYEVARDQLPKASETPDSATGKQLETFNAKVQDNNPADISLTNVQEGLNPQVDTNYDIARLSEHDISAPGPADPSAAEGIAGEKDGPPVTMPPPPGSGGGQGGAPLMDLSGSGLGTREIAEQFHLSVKTVETHRENIKGKLGLQTGSELNEFARRWAAQNLLPRQS